MLNLVVKKSLTEQTLSNFYSKFRLNSVNYLTFRTKIYNATIAPETFNSLVKNDNSMKSSSGVPSVDEINNFALNLDEKCLENRSLNSLCVGLSKQLHQPDCNALIVDSALNQSHRNNFETQIYNSLLTYSALLSRVGLEIMYYDNQPVHTLVNSVNRQRLFGHQDSYFDSQSGCLNLMPFVVLINSNSSASDKTWVKENYLVIDELKKSHQKSFDLLQKVKFEVEIGNDKIFDDHVLLKVDGNKNFYLNQFSSRAKYEPKEQSLIEGGYSRDEAQSAIFQLIQLVNMEKGKNYFCLNNSATQLAILNNKNTTHGREVNFVDKAPQPRNVVVLAGLRLRNSNISQRSNN